MVKRGFVTVLLFSCLSLALMVGSVLADDGRINRPPYHFGGDTLFCNQETGCTLLNKDGHDLANWPQDDIAAAFAAADKADHNVQVKGEGQGTYGPMQLWAMGMKSASGNNTLCLIGFDEWGKQNDMCFEVTQDFHYLQAPLPVVVPPPPPPPAPPCSPMPTAYEIKPEYAPPSCKPPV